MTAPDKIFAVAKNKPQRGRKPILDNFQMHLMEQILRQEYSPFHSDKPTRIFLACDMIKLFNMVAKADELFVLEAVCPNKLIIDGNNSRFKKIHVVGNTFCNNRRKDLCTRLGIQVSELKHPHLAFRLRSTTHQNYCCSELTSNYVIDSVGDECDAKVVPSKINNDNVPCSNNNNKTNHCTQNVLNLGRRSNGGSATIEAANPPWFHVAVPLLIRCSGHDAHTENKQKQITKVVQKFTSTHHAVATINDATTPVCALQKLLKVAELEYIAHVTASFHQRKDL